MGTKHTPKRPAAELVAMVERLEQIRMGRGLTRQQFESVAGIPTGNYSKWAGDDHERLAGIQVATVLVMAKRLGVHPAELLFGPGVGNAQANRPTEPPGSAIRPSITG